MGSAPWHVLLAAMLAAVAGFLLTRPGKIEGLYSALGSAPPGPRERKTVPAMLLFAGAGLLFTFFAEASAAAGQQRPFWVVAAMLLVFPLSGLSLAAVVVWVSFLRRFT